MKDICSHVLGGENDDSGRCRIWGLLVPVPLILCADEYSPRDRQYT